MTAQAPAVRAGVLVTGTEVLTGIISDRNGPWLSERLRELGVDVAAITVVGDRRADLLAALAQMAASGLALIVTSGGLGPTADDLTTEVVASFSGRELILDSELEAQIGALTAAVYKRWPQADREALRQATRKQALVPAGATVLSPRGTAPGLVVPPADGRRAPTIVVLPGPPSELQPMWQEAAGTPAFRAAIAGASTIRREIVRLFGLPEAEIASTLRAGAESGLALDQLEITTCLRRGEIEVSTRFEPAAQRHYDALLAFLEARHGAQLFSRDGSTIDEQVAALLQATDATIAAAESCTGGLLAARLTERPGASAYVTGGAVVYSNRAKSEVLGVDAELIARHGAVSPEVARAMAEGVRARFQASVGVGITGVAGPGGGTADKPVGLVCFSVVCGSGSEPHGLRALTRSERLAGDRAAVRERATTVALHLIARLLQGQRD
jgi:nicotinamide-nucleotide amidase